MVYSYRDPTVSVAQRVEDLLGRMTLEDKAGTMFHTMASPTVPQEADEPLFGLTSIRDMVTERRMNHFNLLGSPDSAKVMAQWHNDIQELAASAPLGIPVTFSSDPRSAFSNNPFASLLAGPMSLWPEPIGLAALRDPQAVARFADIVRREYLAVGIRVALHPQLDLATEPRWARINGTFGEDPELAARLGAAYIRGLQTDQLGPDSVACMAKHFPGGGPQKDGEDPHFPYGREQIYPGEAFDVHLRPFEAAFAAGVSQIMPYYGMPVGTEYEQVGFSFSRSIVTGLLREKYGFDGIVCTDWGLLSDNEFQGQPFPARAWGVEHLTPAERAAKILGAGVDQFGGEACPELVVRLVRDGIVTAERIDASVRRILREKFLLGLFDSRRFVDVDRASSVVGCAEFRAAGAAAQRESLTVLTGPGPVPVSSTCKVYVEGVDAGVAGQYATVVDRPQDADVALLRLAAPYEQRDDGFAGFFHAGSLEYPAPDVERISAICRAVPTVAVVYLDRPAVLGWLAETAACLIAEYGAQDQAVLDVVFGAARARGTLPFDLPRSMQAVVESRSDVPFDTADPVFRCGDGLTARQQ